MSPRHDGAARVCERLEDRLRRSPSESAYPVADPQIVERGFAPGRLGSLESVFAVANGYVGVRGAPEEGQLPFAHGRRSRHRGPREVGRRAA